MSWLSLYPLWRKKKQQHCSWRDSISHVTPQASTWLFSYISTSCGLQCQVERYLHKYSCYFSAQSVIYKFSRLLNSLSSKLTRPAAVNAEWRLWQRRECDCWIVIKHLLQLSMKWGGGWNLLKKICVGGRACGCVFLCCLKAEVLLVCTVLSAPVPMDWAANRPSTNIYCVLTLTIELVLEYRLQSLMQCQPFSLNTQSYVIKPISMS